MFTPLRHVVPVLFVLIGMNCTSDGTLDPTIIDLIDKAKSNLKTSENITNCPDVKNERFFSKDSSTIALWYFNEGVAATSVKDFAGDHDLDMVLNPQWVDGNYGKALKFQNNNCVTPFKQDLFPSNALTVEALVYIDSLPSKNLIPRSHSMIVSNAKWQNGTIGACGYELRLTDSDGKVEFIFGDNNNWHSAISQKRVVPGKWYSIAGQYDGRQISVYVDGELWASAYYTGKIQASSSPTTVARRVDDQPFYFYGKIDELRISSVARYSVCKSNLFTTDSLTIAHWNFNEGVGASVKDYARQHDLSFVGLPQWVTGEFGSALNFSNNNCITPYSPDLFPSNAITVEAYVFIKALPSDSLYPRPHSMIVSNSKWNYGSNGACGYELRLTDSDGKVEFIFGDRDQWHYAISTNKVIPGKWYHIAGQYDGYRISVYVNGVLWASSEYKGKIQPSPAATTIARRIDDQPFYFYGLIDEIRISSVARYQ